MSKETERVALATRFKASFAALNVVNIAWPNKPFETPQRQLFLVYSVVERGTTRHGIGFNFFKRHHGTVQVDIYTPLDKGTKESRIIVDALSDEYEMLEILTSDGELIRFNNPSSHQIDPNVIRAANLEDNWERYVFEAPFYRDQIVRK